VVEGLKVIGIDALSDYYDVALKHARHDELAHEILRGSLAISKS
jgi:hypothetical protein